jgi:hypothetical protein
MAKKVKFDTSFDFGANVKQKKGGGKSKKSAGKGNAWAAYVAGAKKR